MFARIAAAILTLTMTATPAFAQILDGVRQGVRDGDSSSASSKDRDHDDDHERHHDAEHHGRHERDERQEDHSYGDSSVDDDLDEFKAWMVLGIVGSPFWIPHLVANDDFQRPQAFAGYPYADGSDGLVLGDAGMEAAERHEATGYLSLEGAYRNDNLWRTKLETRIHGTSRVGLAASYATYFELRSDNRIDRLSLADANLTFTFAQSPQMLFFAGLGARALVETRPSFGVNFIYGFDLFLVDPLVLSARFDLGSLGKARVAAASVRAGVFLGRFDLGVGYDVMVIANTSVGGATLGMRTWF